MTATASMTTVPYTAVGTDGARNSGVVSINVSKFVLSQEDVNSLAMQAINNSAARMGLKPGDTLSPETAAQLMIHAATQLYVASTSSLASFYELAKQTFVNQWYLGTPGVSIDESDMRRLEKLRETNMPAYLKHCWDLWSDAVCVEIKVAGFTGNIAALKSDLKHKFPAMLSLPMEPIEVTITKTDKCSATVEANGIKIKVDDLMGGKVPVTGEIARLAREMEIGEVSTITREISPNYITANSSLIRELGAAAQDADSQTAPKLSALAVIASTYGIRQILAEKPADPEQPKARMEKTVTNAGEIVIAIYPQNSWQEAWAVSQLKPHFGLVVEEEGGNE